MDAFPINLTMWQTVVGVLLPALIAVINKPSWPSGLKYWLTFVLCALAAGGDLWWSGQFDLANLPGTFLKILFLCVGSYLAFWKPSGVGDLIERKINGDKSQAGGTQSQAGTPAPPKRSPYGKVSLFFLASASALALLSSSGCTVASIQAYPPRATDPGMEIQALAPLLQPEVITKCRTGDKQARLDCRDSFIDASVRSMDLLYSNFEQDLWQESTLAGIGADLFALGLTAAGTFATGGAGLTIPATFGPVLAATATYLTGAKASWDKRTFWDRSLVAVLSSMRANRLAVLVRIRECQRADTNTCPIGMALSYLDDYYKAGSIPGALVDIGSNAQAVAAEALRKMRSAQ